LVLIWGLNFAVVKRALEVFSPLGFNALRYLLASLFVYAVLRSRGPLRLPDRRDMGRIVVLGLLGNTIYQLAFITGLDRTLAGNAALMLALVPVFILLLGIGRGSGPGVRAWIGALTSVAGVALVSLTAVGFVGSETLLGDLLMISAAGVWAVYTVESRTLIEKYGSLRTTAWTLWTGALGIFIVGIPSLTRERWGEIGAAGWGGLAYSAFLSIGLAYIIWYRGVERLGSARTAIFSNITPVVALAAGALWLGEPLGILSLFGAAMVIGGVFLVRGAQTQ
jgi:drug/metabolite transporter (DMT)-like permease